MLFMTPYQTPRCAAPFISYMPFRLLCNVHAPRHSGYRLKPSYRLVPARLGKGLQALTVGAESRSSCCEGRPRQPIAHRQPSV